MFIKNILRMEKEIPWKYLLYGSLAGTISHTSTAPLEFYRLHLQVRGVNPGVSTSTIFKDTIKRDGIGGLFKGNGMNVMRIVPAHATRFFTFILLDRRFNKENSSLKTLACASTAGIVSTTLTYPLDLIRSRMTSAPAGEKRYTSILDAFKNIYKREGFLGLYRGMSTSLFGASIYIGIDMTVFKKIKKQRHLNTESHFSNVLNGIGLGIVSGTTALTCSYPTDVIRRRKMLEGLSGSNERVTDLIRVHGIRSLYWGFMPTLIKVVPTTAIGWGIMELCRSIGGE